jgi:Flp pilus assembly protein TadG
MQPRINKKGFVAVFLSIGLLVVLLAFAGLAVDIGRAYKVRGELQNSADAASLSGASKIYSGSLTPDWANAKVQAIADIQLNKSEGASIVDSQVQYGYWNNGWTVGSPVSTGTPPVPSSSGYSSAVSVAVSRPVPALLARVVGWTNFTPGASAIAASGFPKSVPPGGSFPFVLTTCVTNDYFSRNPLPNPPTEITDTSVYHLSNGTDIAPGQWTSLTVGKEPSASTLSGYIDYLINPADKNASPSPAVQTVDSVWIDPGTKASVYHTTQDLINAGKGLVLLPVVDCNPVPDTDMTIRGFVAMQLDSTTNSSMSGHFVAYYESIPGVQPGGPPSNTVTPPVMVK